MHNYLEIRPAIVYISQNDCFSVRCFACRSTLYHIISSRRVPITMSTPDEEQTMEMEAMSSIFLDDYKGKPVQYVDCCSVGVDDILYVL
jgi:hypothetical protein